MPHEFVILYVEVKHMKFKKIVSASLCALYMLGAITANAAVLGSETIKHARLNIGEGAVLETNVFYGDQSGVGNQSEYFVEYTPNTKLRPVLINEDIYGYNTVSSVANSLIGGGAHPTMLMNSDFFAMSTGIPLSHQVIDGILTVMDANDMDAIGFNSDGSAFISHLGLGVTVFTENSQIEIGAVNKLRQPYGIYMYTDRFSATTKADTKGINAVIGSVKGSLSIDSTVRGVIESVTEDDGAIPIPEGKIVLSIDTNAPQELVESLKALKEGDHVDINIAFEGDSRFKDATHILGVWGDRLIKDSVITENDDSAAPRTAFGIKEDGTLIFYALDGRNPGHSYGARIKTLAKRLLEIGCVDAVNLDGGGSTTIGTIYPGKDGFSVINKPSDGSERKVSTLIGLINTAPKTSVADKLFIYPYTGNYLAGAKVDFGVYATDKNYYKTPLPSSPVFTAPDGTESDGRGITLKGDGVATVSVKSGSLTASVDIPCYTTPTAIGIANKANGNTVTSLKMQPKESIDLNAYAFVGHKSLFGDDTCFEWKCTGNIGTVTDTGYFTASANDAEGSITVRAGEYTKTIPVSVHTKRPYADITFEEDDDGNVTVNISSDDHVKITASDIKVRLDGKNTDFKFENGKIKLSFTDGKTHKISVTSKGEDGHNTLAGYTTKGKSYDNIFSDVKENHWARDYISYMNKFGVVNGTVDGNKTYFKPSNNITRAEFSVMIANMLSVPTEEYADYKTGFADEGSIPKWCINHIKALNSMGIISGKDAGGKTVFDANATLTRAEASTIIYRILPKKLETKEIRFSDSASIPSWSEDAFKTLASIGILNGYDDGSIKPKNKVTRAEAIKLIYGIF